MAPSQDDDLEHKQNLALRWATSTTNAERRTMLREDRARTAPQTARHAMVLVGLVLMAGAITGLVKAIGSGASGALIAAFGVAVAVCGVAAELGRRGRTRAAFWAIVLCMLGASLVEALQR
ncbi:hypothetical protein [Streptomyces sp. NPDC048639]|uniref:hypothetical protein n=1 Tax=Streptomyces sp. NPDC048639 TaxID=3365581 RepID=UPI0037246103